MSSFPKKMEIGYVEFTLADSNVRVRMDGDGLLGERKAALYEVRIGNRVHGIVMTEAQVKKTLPDGKAGIGNG